jgi:3-oxoadipate enol-lactonase
MPNVLVDDCRLWFVVEGPPDAPALLLSNALGTTAAFWEDQVPAFAHTFRVIRYDPRGHGRSDAPSGDYTIDRLGRDALAILDAAEAPSAGVCGLSLGGLTALWMAVHAPSRVSRIVVANTAARIGTPAFWQERIDLIRAQGLTPVVQSGPLRWFSETFRERHPEIVASAQRMQAGCVPDGYIGCAAALRDADLRDAIASIAAPTLAIAGRFDPVTPPYDTASIRLNVAGARFLELDAAHFSNIEQSAAFNDAVLDFLSA